MSDDNNDAEVQAKVRDISQSITKALNQGDTKGAVKAAVCNGPLPTKNQAFKDELFAAVLPALAAVKEKDMASHIEPLSGDEKDTLMKFLYRGLADGQHPSLLKFHEHLFNKSGYGCITRALCERPTV